MSAEDGETLSAGSTEVYRRSRGATRPPFAEAASVCLGGASTHLHCSMRGFFRTKCTHAEEDRERRGDRGRIRYRQTFVLADAMICWWTGVLLVCLKDGWSHASVSWSGLALNLERRSRFLWREEELGSFAVSFAAEGNSVYVSKYVKEGREEGDEWG